MISVIKEWFYLYHTDFFHKFHAISVKFVKNCRKCDIKCCISCNLRTFLPNRKYRKYRVIIVSKPKISCNIVWTLKKISLRGEPDQNLWWGDRNWFIGPGWEMNSITKSKTVIRCSKYTGKSTMFTGGRWPTRSPRWRQFFPIKRKLNCWTPLLPRPPVLLPGPGSRGKPGQAKGSPGMRQGASWSSTSR